jgi:hypothetical protein
MTEELNSPTPQERGRVYHLPLDLLSLNKPDSTLALRRDRHNRKTSEKLNIFIRILIAQESRNKLNRPELLHS